MCILRLSYLLKYTLEMVYSWNASALRENDYKALCRNNLENQSDRFCSTIGSKTIIDVNQ